MQRSTQVGRRQRWRATTVVLVLAPAWGACGTRPTPVHEDPTAAAARPRGAIQHVVVVTVDGLLPETYLRPDAHGLGVPTLRRLVHEGAFSAGARSVFPTVTYPAHTSIATGVSPLRHGVHANRADDPLESNLDGWRWYAEDIAAPTIWQAARAAGYRTALIGWPVTVGAAATFLVPEVWRAKHPDDFKLLRALSTPGLLEAVARADPTFLARYRPGDFLTDQFLTDIAVHVLGHGEPHLLLVHLTEVDSAQHKHGLWSAEACAAIENADRQLARLIAAAQAGGLWSTSALVVASDHGFAPVTSMVRPGVLLHRAGLVELDAANHVTRAKAFLQMSGGMGYVYLAAGPDPATATALREIFAAQAARPGGGIAQIYAPAEIRAAGGDPRALFAFEATPGGSFGPGYLGAYEAPPLYLGTHGFSPEHPEMQAALLIAGPALHPGRITGARLIDIATTIAAWLGLRLPSAEGRALVW